jgi:hypothetical protein
MTCCRRLCRGLRSTLRASAYAVWASGAASRAISPGDALPSGRLRYDQVSVVAHMAARRRGPVSTARVWRPGCARGVCQPAGLGHRGLPRVAGLSAFLLRLITWGRFSSASRQAKVCLCANLWMTCAKVR